MAIPNDRMPLDRAPRARRTARRILESLVVQGAFALLGAMMIGTTIGGLLRSRFLRDDCSVSMRAATSRLFRRFLDLMQRCGLLALDLSELDALRDEPSLIIAPNHPSLIDAALVLSRLPRPICIMKASLRGNAFLGAGSRMSGYVPNDCARSMIKSSVAAVRAGGQLLIFPEGTRTTRFPMGPATRAFALIASRAQAPVQTVIIETDSHFLGKGWPLWRAPALPVQYRVRLGPRIQPDGSVESIVERTVEAIGGELGNWRPGGQPVRRRTADMPAAGVQSRRARSSDR